MSQIAHNHIASGTPEYFIFSQSVPLPLHSPEAYRVAIPALGRILLGASRLKDPTLVATALDFFFAFFALYFFYRIATDGSPISLGVAKRRILILTLFLAVVQFPLAWVVPWQRPETLPTALFIALALFCLVRAKKSILWSLLLVAAAICQAFVRSDVPLVFGVALALMSFWGKTLEEFGSRSSNLIKGICITLVAVAVQAYIQFILYPHLHAWPGIPIIKLRDNFEYHKLSNCIVALCPFLSLAIFLIIRRKQLKGVDAVIVASSVLYLLVWFTVGFIDEVRLYVPFLIALSVVAAKTMASFMSMSREEPALDIL